MVAVKRIQLEGFKEEEVMQLMQEIDLAKQLSHPNIIKYEGIAKDKNTLSIVLGCVFHLPCASFLWFWRVFCYTPVSDLRDIACRYVQNGSLKQMLEEFGKLSEDLVASYVVQVLEGLDYLHHNDIVHGNLKASNILLTKSGHVKLSDFGLSLNPHALEDVGKGISCMPNWTAPEVIELKRASAKSDMWSLGCTVIESLTGQPPYGDLVRALSGTGPFLSLSGLHVVTLSAVMFRIVEDDGPPIPEGLSDSLVAFLKECHHKDPAQRPSAKELSQHEWLDQSLSNVRVSDAVNP
jgi:serine/threonine protein kinase